MAVTKTKPKGKKKWIFVLAAIVLILDLPLVFQPTEDGGQYSETFRTWNQLLKSNTPGAPAAIIDLDALDNNVSVIQKHLGDRFRLRLVTKSIPSIPLIRYLMEKSGSNRLMAFSEVFLDELLAAFGSRADILLGKPLPVEAAARLIAKHRSGLEVQWLVDTKARAKRYLELAEKLGSPLEVNLEIDVGLHRGGARDADELTEILDLLEEQSDRLELTGFMGYEGHVTHVPYPLPNKTWAYRKVLESVIGRYEAFTQVARELVPDLRKRVLTYNSGGSTTYPFYEDVANTSINDIAVGSAFLAPTNFGGLRTLGHRPALFLATPVLKRIVPGEVPFLDSWSSLLTRWDKNLAVGFALLGGGWTASPVQPPGLKSHFLLDSGGGVQSLLSNQSMLFGSYRVGLEVGDYVFFEPWEGDALVTLESVLAVRDGKIVERWPTFRRGN